MGSIRTRQGDLLRTKWPGQHAKLCADGAGRNSFWEEVLRQGDVLILGRKLSRLDLKYTLYLVSRGYRPPDIPPVLSNNIKASLDKEVSFCRLFPSWPNFVPIWYHQGYSTTSSALSSVQLSRGSVIKATKSIFTILLPNSCRELTWLHGWKTMETELMTLLAWTATLLKRHQRGQKWIYIAGLNFPEESK